MNGPGVVWRTQLIQRLHSATKQMVGTFAQWLLQPTPCGMVHIVKQQAETAPAGLDCRDAVAGASLCVALCRFHAPLEPVLAASTSDLWWVLKAALPLHAMNAAGANGRSFVWSAG